MGICLGRWRAEIDSGAPSQVDACWEIKAVDEQTNFRGLLLSTWWPLLCVCVCYDDVWLVRTRCVSWEG